MVTISVMDTLMAIIITGKVIMEDITIQTESMVIIGKNNPPLILVDSFIISFKPAI